MLISKLLWTFQADIERAVEAASAAFKRGSEWRKMDASARGRLLNKLAALMARDQMYLAQLETLNNGKPLEQAISDTPYGLAAGIISTDINQALKFAAEVEAGSIWVNGYMDISCNTPFGGFKHSGFGRELGEDGLNEYCEIKTVTIWMQ